MTRGISIIYLGKGFIRIQWNRLRCFGCTSVLWYFLPTGEFIDLKCADPTMWAENRTDKLAQFFSIKCEDRELFPNKPNFTEDLKWSRCIPR